MNAANQESRTSKRISGLGKRLAGLFKSLNAGLNYDFCPSFNRYVYWMKQPVGWVICGATFSMLVGFFIGPQGFVLMCSFVAMLAIGAVWPWLAMKGLECRLSFDRSRSQEDSMTTAIVEITNKWPLPVFGLMVKGEFLLDLQDDDDQVAIGLQRVPAWSVSRFTWKFEPKQRGVLPFDQPILMNGFPFGLYQCERPITVQKQTIVWPADCPLQGAPGLDGTQFNIAGMMSDRPGVDGDVIGIRQYRQGDSLKHVHWAKTATLGRLIVQERQTSAQRPFEVVVDLTPENHRGQGSQSSYEWAIRVAASVCNQLNRHHSQVQLLCLGLTAELQSQASNVSGIGPLQDFLATLPTLDALRELKTSQADAPFGGKPSSPLAKRFFVCTNLSSQEIAKGDVQRIELHCERFDPWFEEAAEPAEIEPVEVPRSNAPTGILISRPDVAANELQNGWSRRMGYGS